MRLCVCVMFAAVPFVCAPIAYAQKAAAKGKPLDQLDSAIGQLGSSPEQPAPKDAGKKADADPQASVEKLKKELSEKKKAIQQLEDENEKLRQALRLRFGNADNLPPVPIPNRDLLESVLKEPAAFTERKEKAGDGAAPEEYTVVSEWGRSPEVAASLPGEVASLIGLALAVPPGMQDGDLRQLGQDLRKNYQSYDNINIEVFDDVEAARHFANEGKSDPAHRMLSITKFKHSGRDTFVVYRNGQAVNIP